MRLRPFAISGCAIAIGWITAPNVRATLPAQSPPARPPLPGAPAGVTAFVDVGVIPMDGEQVLSRQTVLVEGGRITTISPVGRVRIPPGALRIDGKGQFLLPGLADMHVHIEPSEPTMLRFLAQGVTTVRYMEWTAANEKILRWRRRAAAGEVLSPRIYTAGRWMGATEYSGLRKDPWQLAPDAVAGRIAAYQAAGYDFVKPRNEPPAIFDSVVAAARRVGLPLAGHVPPGVPIERALAARMKSIEHLTGYEGRDEEERPFSVLMRPDGSPDPAKIRAIAAATKRAGTWNCPTLRVTIPPGADTSAFYQSPEGRKYVARQRELVRALQDAGAGLLLGTDGSAVVEELVVLVEAGLTPYQALATGTRNVAEYFGTLEESGTIAAGKRADLVLVAGNPLADVRHVARPAGVMLGGHWLDRAELERRLPELRTP
jgi:imidazolonepropionase-like amidohydrolase